MTWVTYFHDGMVAIYSRKGTKFNYIEDIRWRLNLLDLGMDGAWA
jgi:hypothetical protein